MFVRFVVDGREVARVELRAPFNWLGGLGQAGSRIAPIAATAAT